MASTTGPLLAGAGANDESAGDAAWSNPQNITASDNSRAVCGLADGQSTNYLIATNFGFSLPLGSIILGVQVAIEHRKSAVTSTIQQSHAYLVVGGVIQSGADNFATLGNISTTETAATAGSLTSTAGVSLTAADVNDPGFGAAIRYTKTAGDGTTTQAQVDRVSLVVAWQTPGGDRGFRVRGRLPMMGMGRRY